MTKYNVPVQCIVFRWNSSQVKSFFNPINNQVVLIDSRVTDEIAVEEVLHPLVAALKIENKEPLFHQILHQYQ